jgi:2-octaprenyl-6-methoxyphenol hydroxylase
MTESSFGPAPDPGASPPLCFDIAVVGAGPAGLVTALALARVAEGTGTRLCLIGPPPRGPAAVGRDTRTAALMESSVELLRQLGVWQALSVHAAPLQAIRIVDAANAAFAAPEVVFRAEELGLAAFGYNIPNAALVEALYARVAEAVRVIPHAARQLAFGEGGVRLDCEGGGTIAARLVVAADGRNSLCRSAAGIKVRDWRYPQCAIATSFEHERPHHNVSTELHRREGPLTTVPLPDPHASSLVWVTGAAEGEALMQLAPGAFAAALQRHLYAVTGAIDTVGARGSFPVAGLSAQALTGPRLVLVGETAHILPPIGAQGLNLGFRDAACLADRLAPIFKHGGDPGSGSVLSGYADSRRLDVMTRTVGVDLLNRSLLTGFLPVQAARGALLRGLKAVPALRRFAMRAGLAPPTPLPSLMRAGR